MFRTGGACGNVGRLFVFKVFAAAALTGVSSVLALIRRHLTAWTEAQGGHLSELWITVTARTHRKYTRVKRFFFDAFDQQ